MNYIKQLQEENKTLKQQIKAHEEGLMDIIRYLNLPKFSIDTSVNKQDILNRIEEIRQNVLTD